MEYEPHNKTAKDFYPQLLQKVIQHQSSSSDENCNNTSSLEAVDNEILDNDNIDDDDDSSSITSSSSNSTTNGSMDLNSFSDEDIGEEMMQEEQDQEDLINASLSNDSSDTFPESMSSSESIDHRGNCSPTFSFTSLLLDENPDDINNNEPISAVPSSNTQPPINPSPFTSKLVNMIKRKLN